MQATWKNTTSQNRIAKKGHDLSGRTPLSFPPAGGRMIYFVLFLHKTLFFAVFVPRSGIEKDGLLRDGSLGKTRHMNDSGGTGGASIGEFSSFSIASKQIW